MSKPLTRSEQLVGRRLPPYPAHFDTYLSGYVKPDGAFCGRCTPDESWLRPAHMKARRGGLIQFSGVSLGPGSEIWHLTERGQDEATAAKARHQARMAERIAWGRDHAEALRKGIFA